MNSMERHNITIGLVKLIDHLDGIDVSFDRGLFREQCIEVLERLMESAERSY